MSMRPMQRVTSQLQNAARSFAKFSNARPEIVQTGAGFITWMIGNAVTQSGREYQDGTDVRELIIYGSYGSLVSNVGHVWYRYLNVVTGRTFRLGTYPGIGAKLAADCLLFNPIHVCCLLSYTHILKGKKIKELPTELKKSIGPMVVAEAAIWTPVQFLNFRLLPAQHQQMFVNFMSIVEAAVLSWLAEQGMGH